MRSIIREVMIRRSNLSRTWTHSTLCVLCVCDLLLGLQHGNPHASSRYIGQGISASARARTCVDGESESESALCVSSVVGGWLRRPCFTQGWLKSRTQSSITLMGPACFQGCLQRWIHHQKERGLRCSRDSRLMMNASCSFGPGSWGLGPGSWVLGSWTRLMIS